ncbi:hypothetical protein COV16_07310 [Candidatus Woesearchaeota archaeon CG10_big_fil_rev_8_21_14_0_10_34_8]|nr:MAG: hypothetical protein COV16_07310 [Candidatus Woesearchaeota archaeon CG10_big_fil_rev_8_21_14_0_10_34_8]
MAMLDKLKFWKKKDEFADLDKELGNIGNMPKTAGIETKRDLGLDTGYSGDLAKNMDTGLDLGNNDKGFEPFGMEPPGHNENPFARQQTYQPQQLQPAQPVQQAPSRDINTQLDLVSAKLETLKVSLESINQRLLSLERAMHVSDYTEQPPRRRRGAW